MPRPRRTRPKAETDAPPTIRAVESRLGPAARAFDALAQRGAGSKAEWRRYKKNAPWVLKVSAGERTLYYLHPEGDAFSATVVLGPRAVVAALAGGVSATLHSEIRAARAYAEGRPVRVTVRGMADVALVEQLVAVKLDPTSHQTSQPSRSSRAAPRL